MGTMNGVDSAPHRSDPALTAPPDDLTGFPTASIASTWYRNHRFRQASPDGGCWFFSGHEPRSRPEGRFDLPLPNGTCYLASSPAAAAHERCGRFLASRTPIPRSFVRDHVVSAVESPSTNGAVADTTHRTAVTCFGVVRGLFTTSDYGLSGRWAAALEAAGHGGLVFQPRFSSGDERALAVFHASGPAPMRAVVASQTLEDVLAAIGAPVTSIPGRQAEPDDSVQPDNG
ncbi:MAG: RES domain-containing protein [Actinobacteria bacterium]|nr:RES domain-containing protein [Actinomycetota bacterium]